MSSRLVLYHSPSCSHCLSFKERGWPEFVNRVRNEQNTEISQLIIEEIDCKQFPHVAVNNSIIGLPTVKLYVNDDEFMYNGNRTADDLYLFVNKYVIKKSPRIVLYYSPKCSHCVIFKERGWPEFINRVKNEKNTKMSNLIIEEIDCKQNPNIAKNNNVTGFPTVKLYINNNEFIYRGNRTGDDLYSFVYSNIS